MCVCMCVCVCVCVRVRVCVCACGYVWVHAVVVILVGLQRRGCRLFLNEDKYERLQQQYRDHVTNPTFDLRRDTRSRWTAM